MTYQEAATLSPPTKLGIRLVDITGTLERTRQGQLTMTMPPDRCPTFFSLRTFLHTAGQPLASAWTGKDAGALKDWGQGQMVGKEGAGP